MLPMLPNSNCKEASIVIATSEGSLTATGLVSELSWFVFCVELLPVGCDDGDSPTEAWNSRTISCCSPGFNSGTLAEGSGDSHRHELCGLFWKF